MELCPNRLGTCWGSLSPPIPAAQFSPWAAGSSLQAWLTLPRDLCRRRSGKCLQPGAAHHQTSSDVPLGAYLPTDRCGWRYSWVFSGVEWGVGAWLWFSIIWFVAWFWRPDVVAQISAASFWSGSLSHLHVLSYQYTEPSAIFSRTRFPHKQGQLGIILSFCPM